MTWATLEVELDFDEPSARYAPTPTAAIITIITTTIAAAAIPLFSRLRPCLIRKAELVLKGGIYTVSVVRA